MFNHIKAANRYKETLFLAFLSFISFSFSVFRLIYTDSHIFLFLNWNLFLAFIPWLFSSIIVVYPNLRKRKLALVMLVLLWLLFFPNAPYILTDLFHLGNNKSMPIWFDLVLILSFAWTGLLFGIMSLWDIESLLKTRLNKYLVRGISVALLFLGAYGIYVGRYLRWNSWDIITEPIELLFNIGRSLKSPIEHPGAWAMSILMGIFLNMIYWSFHLIKNRQE
ncbi:MAG: DUF1361 domain-containing protein [Bacteroidetes bacterium]|nr:DUF1361 domain-containing protein [Bacteroidota bacterium]